MHFVQRCFYNPVREARARARRRRCARSYIASRAQNAEEFDADAAVRRAIQYIDAHFFEDLTVEGLAKNAKLSKSCFTRRFLDMTSAPPKRYIAEKRMHEALRLIHQKELALSRIAEDVGYKDFSTFYRNFYKTTGKSPSAYREGFVESNTDSARKRFQP